MMKKFIARGMASFLIMVIIVLTMFATTIYAAENVNYNIDVNVSGGTVKATFDEKTNVFTIQNQGNESIMDLQVKISVGEIPIKIPSCDLSGLEKCEIDLTQYLSEDLIGEKNIDFQINGYTKTQVVRWVCVVVLIVFGVAGVIVMFKLPDWIPDRP